MSDISITVKLCFDSGAEEVQTMRLNAPPNPETKEGRGAPYQATLLTAPPEPTLVQSAGFVQLG